MVSLPFAAVVGVVVATLGRRFAVAGVLMCAVAWQPLPMVLAIAVGGVGFRWRRLRQQRRDAGGLADGVVLLGELVSLGLGAGLPFLGAVARAADEFTEPLAGEVRQVIRTARIKGSSHALAAASGHSGPLFRLVARAVATGSPVANAVTAFVLESRRARRADRLATAKRLPVRLLVPLTLLILPGFVVLTLGPALLSGLERLQP
jgi:tight adherence protein C